jgi:transposase
VSIDDATPGNMIKTNTNTQKQAKRQSNKKANRIKLGIDVHADSYRVVRQIDGATPQPAQKFIPSAFMKWAAKQVTEAHEVYSCYEAGPFGYGLHRELSKIGIKNMVVRPQNWDELDKGVKTDRTDALALVQRLDRYIGGNGKAFAVVTVPSREQEEDRSISRYREQLREHRQRIEAQGRSMLLYYGYSIKGRWWQERGWQKLPADLSAELKSILSSLRDIIQLLHKKVEQVTKEIEQQAAEQPKGFGAYTSEVVRREIKDWNRFKNRRQIASMTGMCPGVRASGNKIRQGSISKHGNPRLRKALIELAWRVIRYQPDYQAVKRWSPVLACGTSGARKKAAVAIGRKLAIDLWRINTGRADAQKLGLTMNS